MHSDDEWCDDATSGLIAPIASARGPNIRRRSRHTSLYSWLPKRLCFGAAPFRDKRSSLYARHRILHRWSRFYGTASVIADCRFATFQSTRSRQNRVWRISVVRGQFRRFDFALKAAVFHHFFLDVLANIINKGQRREE